MRQSLLKCGKAAWFLILMGIVAGWGASVAQAQSVITYAAPAQKTTFYAKSGMYQVKVNGKEVFIYDFDPNHTLAQPPPSIDPKPAHWSPGVFGSFDFSGRVTVTVTVNAPVQSAVVRPRSAGIKTRIKGNTVSFDLTTPCNVGLEINDDQGQPLFLFANPIQPKPKKNDPNVIYLAGGKIYEDFEWPDLAGKTLYIEGGAIIRCRAGLDKDLTNARIYGTGIVTGSEPTKDQHLFGWTHPAKNFRMDGPIFISTHHGGKWAVVPFKLEDAVLRNVKVFGFFRDGLDVLSCRNLLVDRCFLWSYDDACVIKASQWAETVEVSGITIQNSIIWNHGLMIGFETRSPLIENIVFRNNDIVRYCGNTGSPIKPHPYYALNNPVIGIVVSDQATVRNIRYEDIRIEYPWTDAFFQFVVDKNYATTGPDRGSINGVYLKNIRITDTDARLSGIYRSMAMGMDSDKTGSHTVSNILIEGLFWEGKEIKSVGEAQMSLNPHASHIIIQPLADRKTAPVAPTQLRLSPENAGNGVGKGSPVALVWEDHAQNEDGFILERSEGAGAFREIARPVANLTEWQDRNVIAGIDYRYRIRAYNRAGNSAFSNVARVPPKGKGEK